MKAEHQVNFPPKAGLYRCIMQTSSDNLRLKSQQD